MLISFILPTYNVASFISYALEPLTELPQDEIEVIVVNDGSTDDSAQVAASFKDKLENLVILNQENAGQSAARNRGLEVARGEYIFFYDPDDMIIPEEFKRVLSLIESKNADIFVINGKYYSGTEIGDPIRKDDARRRLGLITGPEYFFHAHKNKEYVQFCWLNFYRRSFLLTNHIRFTEGIAHEDKEFTALGYAKAKSVLYTGINCYLYRQRESSLSHEKDRFYSPKSITSYMRVIDNILARKNESSDPQEIKVFNHVLSESLLTILRRIPVMKKKGVKEVQQYSWSYINKSKAFETLPLSYKFTILRKRFKAGLVSKR